MLARVSALLALAVCFCACSPSSHASAQAAKQQKVDAGNTHEQSKVLKVDDPQFEDSRLNSFCMDSQGNILAALSSGVVRMSPDGATLESLKLDFPAEAISQSGDGTIYVGGNGKLARLKDLNSSPLVVELPWLEDKELVQKLAKKQAAEDLARAVKSNQESVKRIADRLKELKSKKSSERDEERIQALIKQRDSQNQALKAQRERYKSGEFLKASVAKFGKVISVAATNDHLFVCTRGTSVGYEVWRVNTDFKSPKKVISSLGGCCGQCHIYADAKNLYLAANTRFNVVTYDHNGKELKKWGQRGGASGFESCCNPMNLSCEADGSILTAESGAGTIKRFDKKGKLLAVVGKAKIPAGCKNVAIGFNSSLNRYYMLDISNSEICVLDTISSEVPTSETSMK